MPPGVCGHECRSGAKSFQGFSGFQGLTGKRWYVLFSCKHRLIGLLDMETMELMFVALEEVQQNANWNIFSNYQVLHRLLDVGISFRADQEGEETEQENRSERKNVNWTVTRKTSRHFTMQPLLAQRKQQLALQKDISPDLCLKVPPTTRSAPCWLQELPLMHWHRRAGDSQKTNGEFSLGASLLSAFPGITPLMLAAWGIADLQILSLVNALSKQMGSNSINRYQQLSVSIILNQQVFGFHHVSARCIHQGSQEAWAALEGFWPPVQMLPSPMIMARS